MFPSIQKIFRRLTLSAFVLLTCWQVQAASAYSSEEMPSLSFGGVFSTNWLASVQSALPASYRTNGTLDFKKATNGLCVESSRGNVAAQGLWGCVLVVFSTSPESTATGLNLLRGSAEHDYVPAMLNLGLMCENGKFVRRNYNEAFKWYDRAAQLGDLDGQTRLGVCYQHGWGVTPNFSMAARYYRFAATQTNYPAMKNLGYLLMNGLGVDKNEDEAKYWFTRAAKEGGNRRAMYNLSALYAEKYPDTNAICEAYKWIKQSAELGDPLAAYQLAGYYFCGWGVIETNLQSYHYWRFKAAMLGATEGQFAMGEAYLLGDGVPKDPENSKMWFSKAAAKNHPEALYDLALYYLADKTNRKSLVLANQLMLRAAQMGHREAQFYAALGYFRGDVTLSFEMGKEWLAKAAESGWPKAEFLLFELYYHGVSPVKDSPPYPKDQSEGVKWLRRAAEHGYLQAQSTLAVMLIHELAVGQNNVEAEKLLRSAAEHGHPQAQNDLGFAILDSDIPSTNLTEAAMWCKLALAHWSSVDFSERVNVNLTNILSRLTVEQQEEADNRVKNFQPLPMPAVDPKISGWQKHPDYQQED